MNGVVEKAMELINRRIRSMIYKAKLPDYLWDYATEHTAYLRNRVLTAIVKKKTLFEAYTGNKPTIRNLKMFRCVVYPIIPKEKHPLKHDPKFKDSDYRKTQTHLQKSTLPLSKWEFQQRNNCTVH